MTQPPPIVLPDAALGSPRELLQWLARHPSAHGYHLARLPELNARLPDLFRLGGCSQLNIPGILMGRWQGCAGADVNINGINAEKNNCSVFGNLPLPAAAHIISETPGDDARWADAWSLIASDSIAAVVGLGAFNGSAQARRAVVTLPYTGEAPSMSDDHGARHPLQKISSGALVSLPLGGLACTQLTPSAETVAGARWDISERVMDNGVVRIEWDDRGRIARLCSGGVFAPWGSGGATLHVAGEAVTGAVSVRIQERGPVRARIVVSHHSSRGEVDITYTLLAHDPAVRIRVQSAANHLCEWALPLEPGSWNFSAQDFFGVLNASPCCDQTAVLARSAQLGDTSRRGIAVHASATTAFRMANNTLFAGVLPNVEIVLLSAGAVWDDALFEAFLPAARSSASALRIVSDGITVPWICAADGWSGQLLLSEQRGARSRVFIFPKKTGLPLTAQRVNAFGETVAEISTTPEGDGFQIDVPAYGWALMRWRA